MVKQGAGIRHSDSERGLFSVFSGCSPLAPVRRVAGGIIFPRKFLGMEVCMFSVELKFKIADREVSLDRFVDAMVTKVSDTVRSELRQHGFGLPQLPPQPDALPMAVTLDKAAQLIGISKWTLGHHVNRGRIRVTRIGRRILIPTRTLDKLIQEGPPGLGQGPGRTT